MDFEIPTEYRMMQKLTAQFVEDELRPLEKEMVNKAVPGRKGRPEGDIHGHHRQLGGFQPGPGEEPALPCVLHTAFIHDTGYDTPASAAI